jgi:hypothetical protein
VSDANGPIDGTVDLSFALFSVASGGVAGWTEAHADVTATDGLVYVDLGSDTPLDEGDFAGATLYLQITVNGEVQTPRIPVGSVPYALRANIADFVVNDDVLTEAEVDGYVANNGYATGTIPGEAQVDTWVANNGYSAAWTDGSSIVSTNSRVGLGTATPDGSVKLHVESNSNDFSSVRIGSDSANDAAIIYFTNTGDWSVGVDASDAGKFKWAANNYIVGNSNRMTLDTAGNLGIGGVTAPGQRLDIAGGNGRVATGFSWLTNSDRRYKTNITTLEGALAKVMRVRGVRYDALDEKNGVPGHGKHIGVIAQELEEEFPELVVVDPETGYRAVAYDKLGAVALQAVRELKTEKDQLTKQVNDLEERLAAVEQGKVLNRSATAPASSVDGRTIIGGGLLLALGLVLASRRRRKD